MCGKQPGFYLLQWNNRQRFSCLPFHCLLHDIAHVAGASSSPVLKRPALLLAAVCLQTEMLTMSSSLLAAAVPLRVFPFQRGFLLF